MNNNSFEFTGRVGSIKTDYKDNGTIITTLSIGIRNKDKTYSNYYVSTFKDFAEKLSDEVKEGDYINIRGVINQDKFTKEGSVKPIYITKFVGFDYKPVKFDVEKGYFVEG